MNKNFNIKDGVLLECSGELFDLRGGCELIGVNFRPGKLSSVEMVWKVDRSNQQIEIDFKSVEDFIVKGRDSEYPLQSGTMLAIAGFSDGVSVGGEDHFYLEPSQEMSYMSFVMDDMSAFLVKAESVSMRRV